MQKPNRVSHLGDRVAVAYHSSHYLSIGDEFALLLRGAELCGAAEQRCTVGGKVDIKLIIVERGDILAAEALLIRI